MIGLPLMVVLAACGNEGVKTGTPNTESTPPVSEQASDNTENTGNTEDVAEQPPTAEELLTRIIEASKDIQSYSMDSKIEQNMSITAEGNEQTQKMKMDMKSDLVIEPMTVYQEVTTTMPGQDGTQKVKQYISEDGVYTQVEDTWMLLPKETTAPLLKQMKNQTNAAAQFEQLNSIASDLQVAEEDDVYWLKAKLSGDKVQEFAATMLAANGATDPQMIEMMKQMNIKTMDISYGVDKKTYFPKDLTYSMDMNMDIEGQALTIQMNMDSSLKDYNKKDSIEVPQEVKENALEQQMPEQPAAP